ALNPSMTIGGQITETILRHRPMHHDDAQARAAQLLGRVRVANPERVLKLYPHELSGGMQQRANIAIAIALDPALLVMDEPTTALDASVQSEIIAILDDLRREHRTSIL
ncbi:ABC transporter ATP-binding protein, partial [Mesorhizobium sp. M2D.F.Ca.ET.145.01.1.1]